jgi:hypothetical protein
VKGDSLTVLLTSLSTTKGFHHLLGSLKAVWTSIYFYTYWRVGGESHVFMRSLTGILKANIEIIMYK